MSFVLICLYPGTSFAPPAAQPEDLHQYWMPCVHGEQLWGLSITRIHFYKLLHLFCFLIIILFEQAYIFSYYLTAFKCRIFLNNMVVCINKFRINSFILKGRCIVHAI